MASGIGYECNPAPESNAKKLTMVEYSMNEHLKRIASIRCSIAYSREDLRIELARLAAVKKLVKGKK